MPALEDRPAVPLMVAPPAQEADTAACPAAPSDRNGDDVTGSSSALCVTQTLEPARQQLDGPSGRLDHTENVRRSDAAEGDGKPTADEAARKKQSSQEATAAAAAGPSAMSPPLPCSEEARTRPEPEPEEPARLPSSQALTLVMDVPAQDHTEADQRPSEVSPADAGGGAGQPRASELRKTPDTAATVMQEAPEGEKMQQQRQQQQQQQSTISDGSTSISVIGREMQSEPAQVGAQSHAGSVDLHARTDPRLIEDPGGAPELTPQAGLGCTSSATASLPLPPLSPLVEGWPGPARTRWRAPLGLQISSQLTLKIPAASRKPREAQQGEELRGAAVSSSASNPREPGIEPHQEGGARCTLQMPLWRRAAAWPHSLRPLQLDAEVRWQPAQLQSSERRPRGALPVAPAGGQAPANPSSPPRSAPGPIAALRHIAAPEASSAAEASTVVEASQRRRVRVVRWCAPPSLDLPATAAPYDASQYRGTELGVRRQARAALTQVKPPNPAQGSQGATTMQVKLAALLRRLEEAHTPASEVVRAFWSELESSERTQFKAEFPEMMHHISEAQAGILG